MNKFYSLFTQSVRAILNNKARSFLTALGIIIGVASVIGLMSIGTGASENIINRITDLGVEKITVSSGAPRVRESNNIMPGMGGHRPPETKFISQQSEPTLTAKDLKTIKSIDQVDLASGVVNDRVVVEKGDNQSYLEIYGIQPEYFAINNLEAAAGRLITASDLTEKSQKVIIGNSVVKDLGFNNPEKSLGKTISIEDNKYQIVGVLAETEQNMRSNPNSQSFGPITTIADLLEKDGYQTIEVKVKDQNLAEKTAEDIKQLLLDNHSIENEDQADFGVSASEDILSFAKQATSTFTTLLVAIAAISLLVGGIGIMNIMIVSVTERTQEIGLRKAVGATKRDIIIQFLIESIILTLLGGGIGILAGIGLGQTLEPYLGFNSIVSGQSILLAAGVSIIIGLIFGLYPAIKASQLRPIDALRYE